MFRPVPLSVAALFAAGLLASPAPAQEGNRAIGSDPAPAVVDPWAAPHDPLNVSGEQLDWAGGRKPAAAGGPESEPLEVWGELKLEPVGPGDREEPGGAPADPDFEPAPPSRDPAEAVAPAAAITPEVPGAASVEPVLRCVYRPHPTRVAAVYEFLKRHAAAGVDVSLRAVDAATGEPVAGVKYVATAEQRSVTDLRGGQRSVVAYIYKPVAPDDQELRQELVVVAPAETQRAVGLFFQLALSEKPAAAADDQPSGFAPVERRSGELERGTPPLQPYPGPFGAAPPRIDAPDVEGSTVAGFEDFVPPADPFESPLGEHTGFEGFEPPPSNDRTTRRPVPRDE